MKLILILCHALLAVAYLIAPLQAYPRAQQHNPNLEYELINESQLIAAAAATTTTTRPPIVLNTPPPVDANSKSFVYDAKTKKWSVIKKGDPPASEDALIWNQSNDKWLTNVPRF